MKDNNNILKWLSEKENFKSLRAYWKKKCNFINYPIPVPWFLKIVYSVIRRLVNSVYIFSKWAREMQDSSILASIICGNTVWNGIGKAKCRILKYKWYFYFYEITILSADKMIVESEITLKTGDHLLIHIQKCDL